MILENYLSEIQSGKDRLDAYDKEFYDSIDKGDQMLPDHPKGKYYTLISKNKKVAITGVISIKREYFQIAVHQKFRRKGYLKICADLIAKKHKIKLLVSSILEDNKVSIGAHLKAGFRKLTKEEEKEEWRKNKKYKRPNSITLIKEYK